MNGPLARITATGWSGWKASIRPWLILGRVSNLPTVWSNVLAAWLLAGGGLASRLSLVLAGASCVYVGGMLLNDACDVAFDRRYRQERPIPSGEVAWIWVGLAAAISLLAGLVIFAMLGGRTLDLGLLLVAAVVVYDTAHKAIAFSPLVMALCRYLLYLVAASAALDGVTGGIVWSALVLGGYVVGLSYVARGESQGGVERWWPLFGLALPVLLAGLMNPPADWGRANVAAPLAIYILWSVRSLSHLFRGQIDGPRRAVSGLLAGIILTDWVALMPEPWPWGVVIVGLFALALLLQRVVPAT